MDIFQVLKKDHQEAKELFKKIKETGPRAAKSREKLFAQLKCDLEAHSYGEENVFYPLLKEHAEMEDLVDEAMEEHEEVADLLGDLEDLDHESDEWNTKLAELKKNVEHHVKEEEGKIFKMAKSILSKEEVQTLAQEFQDSKKQATAS
ncbi:MAG: hemerythrin [Nitrospirales bacterium]|nr:MAG: hemerythrin [Nitrospirales bacterium]